MNKGDRINMKDGRRATIIGFGLGDFIGDPYPVYILIDGESGQDVIMSDELAPAKSQSART